MSQTSRTVIATVSTAFMAIVIADQAGAIDVPNAVSVTLFIAQILMLWAVVRNSNRDRG